MTDLETTQAPATDSSLPDPAPPPAPPPGDYAIVEILGHQTLVGRVEEVERFGGKMLRIEPIFCGLLLGPIYQGGASIYRFLPCSAEAAFARAPRRCYQLPDAVRAVQDPHVLEDLAAAQAARDRAKPHVLDVAGFLGHDAADPEDPDADDDAQEAF